MSYNNHLTFLFCSTYTWNKFTINRLIIKIVFWLVYDYGFIFFAECKIKNQEYNTTLAW